VWYDGPYRRVVAARILAKTRRARPKSKGLRKAADIERRPVNVQHTYRYQLHRVAS
jgi:hypothetical protein